LVVLPDAFSLASERSFTPPLVIGVISDTHIRRYGSRRMPPEVPEFFSRFGCGLIVHLGDVQTIGVLESLGQIAPVLAVRGNNDEEPELQSILPMDLRFSAGKFAVVLVHGHGGYSAHSVAKQFVGKADLILYGHSHIPMIEHIEGTTLFNPGSATDRRWHEHFGVGVVAFNDDRCLPELILFRDPRELDQVRP